MFEELNFLRRSVLVFFAVASIACRGGQTELLFFFDAEDYTSPRNAQGIKDLADLCTSEGITAHFATVGELARALKLWKREDVIASLRPHLVCTHTLAHSWHPVLAERSDVEDFDGACSRVLADEALSVGLIRGILGKDSVWAAVPPGNCESVSGYCAYAELGIRFFCGSGFVDNAGHDIWFCNLRQIPYVWNWERFFSRRHDWTIEAVLNELARSKRGIVYCHPNMVRSECHWDLVNCLHTNAVPWGEWREAPVRDEAQAQAYLGRIRAALRAIKADDRFRITTLPELSAATKGRVAIRRSDVPAIRAALERDFGPVTNPASWCVSDVFVAAVRMLRGEDSVTPGRAYGFLAAPAGVVVPTRLKREDILAAARTIDIRRFLPSSIRVGPHMVGPADFLFAMLSVLEGDASEVEVRPRDQLGDFRLLPKLEKYRLDGTWVYEQGFKDKYVTDRIRWQLWTLRWE